MKKAKRTSSGEALTDLVLDLFRFDSLLLTAGDRLVAPLGLTSARWQVLGAIIAANRPQPVAWLARDLGGNRPDHRVDDAFMLVRPAPRQRREADRQDDEGAGGVREPPDRHAVRVARGYSATGGGYTSRT